MYLKIVICLHNLAKHTTELRYVLSNMDIMIAVLGIPILGIRVLHLTHPKCTHTAVNTNPGQLAAIYAAAPGEQLGVWCLAQGHLSCGNEGLESAVHSLPPPTIPAGLRLDLATFGLIYNL